MTVQRSFQHRIQTPIPTAQSNLAYHEKQLAGWTRCGSGWARSIPGHLVDEHALEGVDDTRTGRFPLRRRPPTTWTVASTRESTLALWLLARRLPAHCLSGYCRKGWPLGAVLIEAA